VQSNSVGFPWFFFPPDPNGLAAGHALRGRIGPGIAFVDEPSFGPGLPFGQSFATQLLVESTVDLRNESAGRVAVDNVTGAHLP